MKLGDCIEKLVLFTKRENVQHFGQCILHVQTNLLISQCKCLPRPHTITWPSKNEEDVFNEASRTYRRAMYLLKQVKSKPAEYNGNLKEVSVVWLPFLLQSSAVIIIRIGEFIGNTTWLSVSNSRNVLIYWSSCCTIQGVPGGM